MSVARSMTSRSGSAAWAVAGGRYGEHGGEDGRHRGGAHRSLSWSHWVSVGSVASRTLGPTRFVRGGPGRAAVRARSVVGERLTRSNRFDSALRDRGRSSRVGAQVVVPLRRACRISDAPGRRMHRGDRVRRRPKAWVTPRLRSWILELHRTGSGKLAPRKPASNSPDMYLFCLSRGRARAAALTGQGFPCPSDPTPGLLMSGCAAGQAKSHASARPGFRAVARNSVRGVDTRPGCS